MPETENHRPITRRNRTERRGERQQRQAERRVEISRPTHLRESRPEVSCLLIINRWI